MSTQYLEVATPAGPLARPARYSVQLFIGTPNHSAPIGTSRDISVSGIFIETGERPEVGTLYPISLVWGDDAHEFRARVVRHATDGVGLSFVDPDPFFLQAVKELAASVTPT